MRIGESQRVSGFTLWVESIRSSSLDFVACRFACYGLLLSTPLKHQ